MRRLAVPAALALVLLAPLAGAHGGGEFPHVNPLTISLAPGAEQTVELTFTEGGPNGTFEAGWLFVLNAILAPGSAPMVVELRPGHIGSLGEPAASWGFQQPGAAGHVTATMPVTGVYSLVFRNPAPEDAGNATLRFFYDQSCNCVAKPIPPEVPNGLVIFNADPRAGTTWRASFFEPPVHTLKVSLAEQTGDAGRWPQDFRVLQESTGAKPVPNTTARVHELTWTASKDQRYYFFVQSVRADLSRFDTSSAEHAVGSIMVTPLFEQVAAAPPKPTPLGAELLLAPLAAALLALAWRRRA